MTGVITHTPTAEGFDASEDGTGRGEPIVATYSKREVDEAKRLDILSVSLRGREGGGTAELGDDVQERSGCRRVVEISPML